MAAHYFHCRRFFCFARAPLSIAFHLSGSLSRQSSNRLGSLENYIIAFYCCREQRFQMWGPGKARNNSVFFFFTEKNGKSIRRNVKPKWRTRKTAWKNRCIETKVHHLHISHHMHASVSEIGTSLSSSLVFAKQRRRKDAEEGDHIV